MILGTFRLVALGVVLAGSAVPALAGAADGAPVAADARSVASAAGENHEASRSRRVELPFPLEFRAPDREPPARAPQRHSGPHPFRELLFKRASLSETADLRLSRLPEFS